MAINTEAKAWEWDEEVGWNAAIRTLKLEADTEADAEFLAQLLRCFWRGKVDTVLLSALSRKLIEGK